MTIQAVLGLTYAIWRVTLGGAPPVSSNQIPAKLPGTGVPLGRCSRGLRPTLAPNRRELDLLHRGTDIVRRSSCTLSQGMRSPRETVRRLFVYCTKYSL
jgi:hypothetical protein